MSGMRSHPYNAYAAILNLKIDDKCCKQTLASLP